METGKRGKKLSRVEKGRRAPIQLPWSYVSCFFLIYFSGKSGLTAHTGTTQRGTAHLMEWRQSSKPDSCLKGTVGSLFSTDSWVERSKIEQARHSVAGPWEGRSRESCELIPDPPLAT